MKQKNIADVYPLSEMQQLMLFHSLSSPKSDALFSQFHYSISGSLDVSSFQFCWQNIVDRHAALRTAFVWEGLEKPLQIVRKRVPLAWEHLDWRELSVDRQKSQLDSYLITNRKKGFNLSSAPLMRMALIRLNDECYDFIWTSHHLVLDRWCIPLIMEELAVSYESYLSGSSLATLNPASYRDYIEWLQHQDHQAARLFWQRLLEGFREPSALNPKISPEPESSEPELYIIEELRLAESITSKLKSFARQQKLTLNTIFQGVWALLLSRYCEKDDVVFGTTVSGRPEDLNRVEEIIGSFINNMPIRIKLPADEFFPSWLQKIQNQQLELRQFEHSSPAQIHQWSEIPDSVPLFDSLLIVQPSVAAVQKFYHDVEISSVSGKLITNFPITLTIEELDSRFILSMTYDSRRFLKTVISDLLNNMATLLQQILDNPDRRLAELPHKQIVNRDFQPKLDHPVVEEGSGITSLANSKNQFEEILPTDRVSMENQLLEIWEKILGRKPLGLNDNFFDLGGNSILAAQIFNTLEKNLGIKLSPTILLQAPTIRQLFNKIYAEKAPETSTLVPIQPEGNKAPFFCVALPDVGIMGYSFLSRHLGKDQPVFVLQPEILDNSAQHQNTQISPSAVHLQKLAKDCIDTMLTFQPEGPYLLGGMCGGALVAYEMARQLRSQGREAPSVIIINTWSDPGLVVPLLWYFQRSMAPIRWYKSRIKTLFQLERTEQLAFLRSIALKKLSGVRQWFTRRPEIGRENSQFHDSQVMAQENQPPKHRVFELPERISVQTECNYDGRITLFRIRKQQYFKPRDYYLGWRDKTSEKVEVHMLSTKEHLDILRDPFVQALAEPIKASLKSSAS